MATTLSGIDTISTRTLDGLVDLAVDVLSIGGSNVVLSDYFNKVTDDSDDIIQGVAQLFVSPAEKADFHKPVTIASPANGLNIGGSSGQELSIAIADAFTTGALDSNDWTIFNSKQDPISATAPLTFIGNNMTMPVATTIADGYLASNDFTLFTNKQNTITTTAPLSIVADNISMTQASPTTNGWLSSNDYITFSGALTNAVLKTDQFHYVNSNGPLQNSGLYVFGAGNSRQFSLLSGNAGSPDIILLPTSSANSSNSVFYCQALRTRTTTTQDIVFENDTQTSTHARIKNNGDVQIFNRTLLGSPSVLTSDRLIVEGSSRFNSNVTISPAGELRVFGGGYSVNGRFGFGMSNAPAVYALESQGGVKTNYLVAENTANAISLVGQQRVYMDFYPRGVSQGMKGYIGFDNPGTTNFVMKNQDTGAIVLINSNNNQFILNANGSTQHISGNNSWCEYGSNSLNSYLRVGAYWTSSNALSGTNISSIQATNQNLHIDCGHNAGTALYTNYYTSLYGGDDKQFRDYSRTWVFGSVGPSQPTRERTAPMPISNIFVIYRQWSPLYASPAANAWVNIPPLTVTIAPLRETSRFEVNVHISINIVGNQNSSVAMRIGRIVAGIPGVVYPNVSLTGINQGHTRTAPVQNSQYWQNTSIEYTLVDHPATTNNVTYIVDLMTYAPSFFVRLNGPDFVNSGQGADVCGSTSYIHTREIMYADIIPT